MDEQNRTFKVGLVGAGYISPFHIRALKSLPNVEIVGITDLDLPRAKVLAKQFNLPDPVPSLRAMASKMPNAIHVMTPPATHTAITLEAIEMGCHVLVEKPLATCVEDCDKIAQAAKAKGVVVCVNHSLLCDPFVGQMLEAIAKGAIGDIITVDYFRSSDYPPYAGGPLPVHYREGGYPFRDLGVHALYLMQAFLGKIKDVTGQFATKEGKGGDPNLLYDEWRALVRCEKGTGQIQLSWNVKPMQNLLLVQGTKGVLRADLFSMAVTIKKNTPLPKAIERVMNAMGESKQTMIQVPKNVLGFLRGKIKAYHGLQTLVAKFYKDLEEGKPPLVSPEDARPIIEWTERVAILADAAKKEHEKSFLKPLTAKILVTGASGFIGGTLVRRLLWEGQRVRLFVRRAPKEWVNDSRIELVLGDLGNPEAVERAVSGVETIYHVGAAMSGGQIEFERGTIIGTQNIINNAVKAGVKKMVYVSSLSVLHAALADGNKRAKEDWPLEPHPERRGHYTATKLSAEKMIIEAAKKQGLCTVIVRPGQVFGPGAPLITGAVARRAGSRFIVLGNGNLILPLVYVDDVVDAIRKAMDSQIATGSIFQLVDSVEMTQNQLLATYMDQSGDRGKVVHLPLAFVYLMAVGIQVLTKLLKRPAPLSVYRVKSALAPMLFDCGAAEAELSWGSGTGVKAGIEKTIKSGSSK
ncbi:MAG: NAD-dependent epimerase/dehydratase family protein [Nitrospirota bacterium]